MKNANYIINPVNNNKINITTKEGKMIVDNYIKNLQVLKGGHTLYNFITDPINNKKILLNSKEGGVLIKNYANFSKGGSSIDEKKKLAEIRRQTAQEYAAKGRARVANKSARSTKAKDPGLSTTNMTKRKTGAIDRRHGLGTNSSKQSKSKTEECYELLKNIRCGDKATCEDAVESAPGSNCEWMSHRYPKDVERIKGDLCSKSDLPRNVLKFKHKGKKAFDFPSSGTYRKILKKKCRSDITTIDAAAAAAVTVATGDVEDGDADDGDSGGGAAAAATEDEGTHGDDDDDDDDSGGGAAAAAAAATEDVRDHRRNVITYTDDDDSASEEDDDSINTDDEDDESSGDLYIPISSIERVGVDDDGLLDESGSGGGAATGDDAELLDEGHLKQIFDHFDKGSKGYLINKEFSAILQIYFGNDEKLADTIAYPQTIASRRFDFEMFKTYMNENRVSVYKYINPNIRYILNLPCSSLQKDPTNSYLFMILNKMVINGEIDYYSRSMEYNTYAREKTHMLDFNNWTDIEKDTDIKQLRELIKKHAKLAISADTNMLKTNNKEDCAETVNNYKKAIVAWFRLKLYGTDSSGLCNSEDDKKVAKYAARVFELNQDYFN